MHNVYTIRIVHTHTQYVDKVYVLLEYIYLFPVAGTNEDIFSLAEALQPNTTGKNLRNIFCISFYQKFIILVILL